VNRFTWQDDDLRRIGRQGLSKAGEIAYDDSLSIDERKTRLAQLEEATEDPRLLSEIQGYYEMLEMLRTARPVTRRRP
jgi:hypothetical protein